MKLNLYDDDEKFEKFEYNHKNNNDTDGSVLRCQWRKDQKSMIISNATVEIFM